MYVLFFVRWQSVLCVQFCLQEKKCPNSDLSPCTMSADADDWMHVPLAKLELMHHLPPP